MSGILDLLNSDLGKQIIGGVSQETNQPADKTASVVSMAMPLLMGAMKRNANSQEGAQGLMNALNNKHDGSLLDNLGGFFGGGVNEDAKQDGLGILGHVLGGSQNNLGKQKKQQNVSSESGIGSLLGGLMGGGNEEPKQQSLIESILDGDNDGSVIDDIAGMVLGGNKGGGGLLEGLFGK